MIDGVTFKELVTHPDNRGFFREIIRRTDPFFGAGFGQLSHSLVNAGVVKGWHGHVRQTQWNYVLGGVIRVGLHDARPESKTYRQTMAFAAGDGRPARVYAFPPGVLHGYKVLAGPMNILYVTSGIYDLTDEVRVPLEDPAIGYDWQKH
jgi:dTDP-4-dehydrorhamnose 3,5-epimerase